MSDAVLQRIRTVLAAQRTVTLAVTGEDHLPWAATVFYASDPSCRLYFVSDENTRHGRAMLRHGRVAAAINGDPDSWDEVLGLQLEGRAEILTGSGREAAVALYLARFPAVQRLFDAPRGVSERLIASRLKSTAFWRLLPARIRLVDNREGFGWKREIALPAAAEVIAGPSGQA